MSLLQQTFSEQPIASTSTLAKPVLSDAQIDRANDELADAEPQAILEWAVQNVPHLFQTTAFGLTGLAATDMLSKIFDKLSIPGQPPVHSVPLIFLDTLYHFPQTIALAEQVSRKYGADLKIFTPENVSSTAQFEAVHGKELWSRDEDSYDYLVKVEPAQRAYAELQVGAVITGRRKSQGGARGSLKVIERDATDLIKINPLANWSFSQVKAYIDTNNVPYNPLLDEGYTSVGDWHSTKASNGIKPKGVEADAAERSGRWAERTEKTECGLHKDFFKMKIAFAKKQREAKQAERDAARDKNEAAGPVAPQSSPALEV